MAKRYWLIGSVLLCLASTPSVALGSPEFPEALLAELQYDCFPTCLLCHNDLKGGPMTATKPFALAMRWGGLVTQQPDTVIPALRKLEVSDHPTDAALHQDMVMKLRMSQNPNVGEEAIDVCLAGPQYGCFASRIEPRGAPDGWGAILAALVVGLLGLLCVRRRRGG